MSTPGEALAEARTYAVASERENRIRAKAHAFMVIVEALAKVHADDRANLLAAARVYFEAGGR